MFIETWWRKCVVKSSFHRTRKSIIVLQNFIRLIAAQSQSRRLRDGALQSKNKNNLQVAEELDIHIKEVVQKGRYDDISQNIRLKEKEISTISREANKPLSEVQKSINLKEKYLLPNSNLHYSVKSSKKVFVPSILFDEKKLSCEQNEVNHATTKKAAELIQLVGGLRKSDVPNAKLATHAAINIDAAINTEPWKETLVYDLKPESKQLDKVMEILESNDVILESEALNMLHLSSKETIDKEAKAKHDQTDYQQSIASSVSTHTSSTYFKLDDGSVDVICGDKNVSDKDNALDIFASTETSNNDVNELKQRAFDLEQKSKAYLEKAFKAEREVQSSATVIGGLKEELKLLAEYLCERDAAASEMAKEYVEEIKELRIEIDEKSSEVKKHIEDANLHRAESFEMNEPYKDISSIGSKQKIDTELKPQNDEGAKGSEKILKVDATGACSLFESSTREHSMPTSSTIENERLREELEDTKRQLRLLQLSVVQSECTGTTLESVIDDKELCSDAIVAKSHSASSLDSNFKTSSNVLLTFESLASENKASTIQEKINFGTTIVCSKIHDCLDDISVTSSVTSVASMARRMNKEQKVALSAFLYLIRGMIKSQHAGVE
eukprot:CAMPEP_0194424834 /NCGR_PEP_ID=MMETSP0176-20130528/24141_1 /TAXON_ID=216777 /ORGANISM="Proboscia alata, Strain PI-D3" /LENGTH=611 /DNA_ID=CAMNT_0039234839 /DNA_START=667 /DNA_END=2502 /DNA_ORIENTATION=+